jgi:hypothetical protein
MSDRTYRVTVRGRFRDLSDEVRRYLQRTQPDHDIFVSAFTPEGTFTYDDRILFFNLRYEVRRPTEPEAAAAALDEAETFLRTMRFGHSPLNADVFDTSGVWNN